MSASDALPRSVLTRKAVVYVRQSTPQQTRNNLGSQRRQYDVVDAARGHGVAQVEVIDDDLGLSASGTMTRPGFERLVALLYDALDKSHTLEAHDLEFTPTARLHGE